MNRPLKELGPTAAQPKLAALQEKAIYDSNEEWWVALKNWMFGL